MCVYVCVCVCVVHIQHAKFVLLLHGHNQRSRLSGYDTGSNCHTTFPYPQNYIPYRHFFRMYLIFENEANREN